MENSQEYTGIRGWLILVAIGVVLKPIYLLISTLPIFVPIFSDGTWQALTTVGSDAYHPMWGPMLIAEMIYNMIMLITTLVLIYLLFTRHYRFPLLFIIVTMVSLLIIPLDSWLITLILPDEPVFDPDTSQEILRSAITAAIWIPYMLMSKRVKATFIERRPLNVTGGIQ